MCAALDEAQQRVGTDTPSSKDETYVDFPFSSERSPGYVISRNRDRDRDRDVEFSLLHRLHDNLGEATVESGNEIGSEILVPKQRKSENTFRSANVEFLHRASKEGLRIISLGMEKAIGQAGNPSGQEILI